jgi:uncharacterized membrane protein
LFAKIFPGRDRLNLNRLTFGVLFTYAFMVGFGLLLGALRQPSPIPLTAVVTLLAFGFAILHAGQTKGWPRAAILGSLVFVLGLGIESLGVATGHIFAPYHYTDLLGPKFLGLVPYLIPLAWLVMMYPSLLIAERLIPARLPALLRWLAVAALAGLAMTAWDAAMDPMMVRVGNWVWEVGGAYFGIPLQNFAGWWLTTAVTLFLYQAAVGRIQNRPAEIPFRWAVWAYFITGLSTVLADLALGLTGPALVGLLVMLPWVVLGFRVKA